MNTSLSKREINRQRWHERIKAWKSSNQSQKAFCEEHHLGQASFQRWYRIFKAEDTEGTEVDPVPVSFMPVRVRETVSSNLIIRIQDDLRIDVSGGFDPRFLQQVIQVLRAL
jgi:hypothetical protein